MSPFDVCRDGFFRKDVVTRREPSEAQGSRAGSLDRRGNGTTNDSASHRCTSYHHGTHGTTHLQHL